MHVDPLLGWVDCVERLEGSTARRRALGYVVAYQEGRPRDVTRRYAASWAASQKLRDEEWWGASLQVGGRT